MSGNSGKMSSMFNQFSDKCMSGPLGFSDMDGRGLEKFKDHDKVNTIPSLKDLYEHITPQYAAEWKKIGIQLGLCTSIGELKAIEVGYPTNDKWYCNQKLKKWLEMDPTASWRKLFTVIESPAVSGNSGKMSSMFNQFSDKCMSGPLGFSDMDGRGLEKFKDHDKVNTILSLKDLYEHITPQYAAEWKVIGTLLDLSSAELRAIEAKFPTNVKWCCNQMLEKWLGLDTTASWGKLFTVIESLAISGQVSDKEMFKKLYYQAKHDLGTEQLQLYKLVIFGPPGVGKSSLFQVLLGSNPDPVHSSTGVLYRKLVQAKVAVTILAGLSKSSWDLLSIDNEILRLRSTIKRVVEKPKQVKVTLPTTVGMATSSYKSQMKVEEKLFQPSTEVSAQIQYASTLMACYDSGGQPCRIL